MKKFTSLIVCAVLVVLSAVWPANPSYRVVMAGPGNGENEEIKDIDEMLDVMHFISGRVGSDSDNTLGLKTELVALWPSVEDDDEKDEYEYESLTWIENTKLEATTYSFKPVYHQGSSYERVSSTHIEMSRNLTCYIVDDASYYVSRGSIITVFDDYVSSKVDNYVSKKVEKNTFVFDIEIYVDDDTALLKFNTFVSDAKKFPDFNNILGKWVELPPEVAFEFITMIDQSNRSLFNQLAEFINDGIENDEYSEKKDVYTFDLDFYGEDDGTISVDLSDPVEPFLDCVIDSSGENGEYIEMRDKFICTNIDNTVINININDSVIEFDDMEEFIEFLED